MARPEIQSPSQQNIPKLNRRQLLKLGALAAVTVFSEAGCTLLPPESSYPPIDTNLLATYYDSGKPITLTKEAYGPLTLLPDALPGKTKQVFQISFQTGWSSSMQEKIVSICTLSQADNNTIIYIANDGPLEEFASTLDFRENLDLTKLTGTVIRVNDILANKSSIAEGPPFHPFLAILATDIFK